MSRVMSRLQRLLRLRAFLLQQDRTWAEMVAFQSDFDPAQLHRDLEELGAERVARGIYRLEPTDEDIALANAVMSRTAVKTE